MRLNQISRIEKTLKTAFLLGAIAYSVKFNPAYAVGATDAIPRQYNRYLNTLAVAVQRASGHSSVETECTVTSNKPWTTFSQYADAPLSETTQELRFPISIAGERYFYHYINTSDGEFKENTIIDQNSLNPWIIQIRIVPVSGNVSFIISTKPPISIAQARINSTGIIEDNKVKLSWTEPTGLVEGVYTPPAIPFTKDENLDIVQYAVYRNISSITEKITRENRLENLVIGTTDVKEYYDIPRESRDFYYRIAGIDNQGRVVAVSDNIMVSYEQQVPIFNTFGKSLASLFFPFAYAFKRLKSKRKFKKEIKNLNDINSLKERFYQLEGWFLENREGVKERLRDYKARAKIILKELRKRGDYYMHRISSDDYKTDISLFR